MATFLGAALQLLFCIGAYFTMHDKKLGSGAWESGQSVARPLESNCKSCPPFLNETLLQYIISFHPRLISLLLEMKPDILYSTVAPGPVL